MRCGKRAEIAIPATLAAAGQSVERGVAENRSPAALNRL
jgi:hypothetical protein